VVSVEIDPPRSVRIERTLDAARLLQDAGVDVVNVSDSAMARVRMGALAVAFGIQHDLDLECVVHVTTRDRNLMALESELLGAHALGVRNILALTGDPPRVGDRPSGTGVWDIDSIGLVEVLARFNRGEDAVGSPIGQAATFTIACALDPTAADAATEWDRLERKLAAGAHLVMTQPLYSLAQVDAMLDEARQRFGPGGFPVPLLLGVLPLQSARHAEFLHNEVPGITIPDATRAAMHDAGEHGAEVGLRVTLDLLEAVGSRVAGTYVMPSFGRYEQAAELVRRLRRSGPAAPGPADRTPVPGRPGPGGRGSRC
jgi:homocysteine S-methyltransferase